MADDYYSSGSGCQGTASARSVSVRNYGDPIAADPPGGWGGWGLGKPDVVRRARRTAYRHSGGRLDGPIGFPKAHPSLPPGERAVRVRTETLPERYLTRRPPSHRFSGDLCEGGRRVKYLSGSVSVRTLTARSPGGRDGWAFGNPIGPASSPPECRSAVRLSRRTTTGLRGRTRLCRPPRGARAAESRIEGLAWNT